MSLAGSRLGPYEILGLLGRGGMGAVYRARDTRLGREVAMKVLTDELQGDTAALARFEREAHAVAALAHPNIVTIFDHGSDDGILYTVTELLEGETLRSRIARAAIDWPEALEIGAAIAAGLAAAHERDLIHRDIKPENIFLCHLRGVKILDFGLVRINKPAVAGETKANQTLTCRTEPGVIVGTIRYMPPEQVRGEPTDARGDIFGLGCILHELAAGAAPFSGDSAAEVLASILKDPPPPLESIRADYPPGYAAVVRRCLEKDPRQRFQSAEDLAFCLKLLKHVGSRVGSGSSAVPAAAAFHAVTPPKGTPALNYEQLVADARTRIREVRATEVKRMMEGNHHLKLIDIREDSEWKRGRLPGAVHVGRGILDRDIARLIPDRETEIVLYCGSGMRSAIAADQLIRMGYSRVASMIEGYNGWIEFGYATES